MNLRRSHLAAGNTMTFACTCVALKEEAKFRQEAHFRGGEKVLSWTYKVVTKEDLQVKRLLGHPVQTFFYCGFPHK